ncbi:hypothetical protein [Gemmobacter sp. LW-1]|uniref:hypothetical protein n=1 Tax=Gemmobacter sp. LW-1 TaxID=1529005 RepID=UPI0006C75F52|nr:hypothetical protein [Gemmobacter sp. LW-1]
MPDQIHTVHISPYIAAQGTAEELAEMGVRPTGDDLITMAARQMLTNHDAFMMCEPCDKAMERRVVLAACFGSEALAHGMCEGSGTNAMIRAILIALIDPMDPQLDYLRACNQPPRTQDEHDRQVLAGEI